MYFEFNLLFWRQKQPFLHFFLPTKKLPQWKVPLPWTPAHAWFSSLIFLPILPSSSMTQMEFGGISNKRPSSFTVLRLLHPEVGETQAEWKRCCYPSLKHVDSLSIFPHLLFCTRHALNLWQRQNSRSWGCCLVTVAAGAYSAAAGLAAQ